MELRKPLSPSPRIQRAVRGVGRYHVDIDHALAAGFALALSAVACRDARHPPGASEDAGDPAHGDDAATDNDGDQPTGTDLKQVDVSSGFACTLRVDGAVACQMLRTGEPVAPFGWTNFKMIALGRGTGGSSEIVGLRSSGEVESYRFLVGTEASVAVADVESIGGGDSHFLGTPTGRFSLGQECRSLRSGRRRNAALHILRSIASEWRIVGCRRGAPGGLRTLRRCAEV